MIFEDLEKNCRSLFILYLILFKPLRKLKNLKHTCYQRRLKERGMGEWVTSPLKNWGNVPPPVKSARRESRHLIALLFRFFRIDSNKILHATPLFHSQWTLKKKSKSGQYVYLFTYSCSWLWHKIDKIDKKNSRGGGDFFARRMEGKQMSSPECYFWGK